MILLIKKSFWYTETRLLKTKRTEPKLLEVTDHWKLISNEGECSLKGQSVIGHMTECN